MLIKMAFCVLGMFLKTFTLVFTYIKFQLIQMPYTL